MLFPSRTRSLISVLEIARRGISSGMIAFCIGSGKSRIREELKPGLLAATIWHNSTIS